LILGQCDELILIAHGAGDGRRTGGVRLRGGKSEKAEGIRDDATVLSANDIKRARGNRKLKKLTLIACGQCNPKYMGSWWEVAQEVSGTDGSVSIWGVLTGKDKLEKQKRGGRRQGTPRTLN
jgi:hypothetical protein